MEEVPSNVLRYVRLSSTHGTLTSMVLSETFEIAFEGLDGRVSVLEILVESISLRDELANV